MDFIDLRIYAGKSGAYGETAFMHSCSFCYGACTLKITPAHTFHSCTLLYFFFFWPEKTKLTIGDNR